MDFGRSFAVRSAGAAVLGKGIGVPAEEFGTFQCGCRADLMFAAVWAGALLVAAEENIVAAFGLTAVNHAVHLSYI